MDACGTVTEEALEKNREAIAAEWNPGAGIEIIFTRVTAAQQLALAAGAASALSDRAAIYLAIKAIECSGVFNDPCSTWRALTDAEQALARFRADFTRAWRERDRRVAAKSAGHEALLTTNANTGAQVTEEPTATSASSAVLIDNVKMHCCWARGLGFNPSRASATCKCKKDGRCDAATVKDRQGGNNKIYEAAPRRS